MNKIELLWEGKLKKTLLDKKNKELSQPSVTTINLPRNRIIKDIKIFAPRYMNEVKVRIGEQLDWIIKGRIKWFNHGDILSKLIPFDIDTSRIPNPQIQIENPFPLEAKIEVVIISEVKK